MAIKRRRQIKTVQSKQQFLFIYDHISFSFIFFAQVKNSFLFALYYYDINRCNLHSASVKQRLSDLSGYSYLSLKISNVLYILFS